MFRLFRKPKKQVEPQSPPVHIPPDLPKGHETLLVAEDDAAIRVRLALILRDLGYQVLEAADGEEALRIAQNCLAGKIELLVTDMVMPKMNAKELVHRLAEFSPQTKVIYCSGYPGNLALQNGIINPEMPYLQKPILPQALALKIREVLDDSNKGPHARSGPF